MSNKKKIISGLILVIITIVVSVAFVYKDYYFIEEDEIILKSDYDEQVKSDVEKQRISFLQEVHGKKEENEKKYDLKEIILANSKVTFEGKHTIKDTSIKCKIEAYNIYQYAMDNIETIDNLGSTEEFVEYMKESIKNGKIQRTTKELELPVEYKDNKLIVNNYSDEYNDAMLGGAYTLLSELQAQAINEHMKNMYELNEYIKKYDLKWEQ